MVYVREERVLAEFEEKLLELLDGDAFEKPEKYEYVEHEKPWRYQEGDYSQQFRDRYDDPRWKCPELIVLWGNNPVVSNSDGLYGHWVTDCMRRGSKTISVDPKMTWLGTKAELHLPLRPGTDAALAMGMLRVMIKEDLYDHDFVEKWCYGFEQLAEAVEPYTLEKTAEITWVEPEKIEKAARMMAAADGWGGENMPEEQWEKRLGIHKYPLYKYGFKNASTDVAINALETGKDENGNDYPMKAAWLQTTNPLINSSPDTRRTYNALNSLEFIVSVDLYMTPTVQALADVVLPACTYAERNGIRIGDGVQRGETINKAVQVGECKSDMVINWEFSRRICPEFYPWETEEDMYSEILSGMGMSFENLRAYRPDPILQINPKAAEKYGVAEGDWVWVENHRGRAKRKVEFCEGLDERYCSTDHGWWLPETGKYAEGGFSGMWDFNINQLLTFDPGKSGFGSNCKTVLCRIYKCEEGDFNAPELYTIDGGELGERARKIEADKEAERQAVRDEPGLRLHYIVK